MTYYEMYNGSIIVPVGTTVSDRLSATITGKVIKSKELVIAHDSLRNAFLAPKSNDIDEISGFYQRFGIRHRSRFELWEINSKGIIHSILVYREKELPKLISGEAKYIKDIKLNISSYISDKDDIKYSVCDESNKIIFILHDSGIQI